MAICVFKVTARSQASLAIKGLVNSNDWYIPCLLPPTTTTLSAHPAMVESKQTPGVLVQSNGALLPLIEKSFTVTFPAAET